MYPIVLFTVRQQFGDLLIGFGYADTWTWDVRLRDGREEHLVAPAKFL
jgi:hypothetical protein